MFYPSEKEFIKLSEKGNLIPVYGEVLADLETPLSAYGKIASRAKYSFLLESVEGEEKIARFSFLAADPELIFQTEGRTATITRFKNGKAAAEKKKIEKSPLTFLREIMKEFRFVAIPGLPRFCGGLIGYMGYDTVRFFERLPHKPADDLKLPETFLVLTKKLIIFDHLDHKIKIVNCVKVAANESLQNKIKKYKTALKEIEKTIRELAQPSVGEKAIGTQPVSLNGHLKVRSNLTEKQFTGIVEKAKEEIRAGEIIQVVLSQRFSVPLKTKPFYLYRMLRSLNPSPYMYYLNFDKIQIVGSSPELLVRCEDGIVETRPIAGTRKRGKNEQEDAALAKDLLNDSKEKAEHIMLVDLGRNDLGRVCRQGTVEVTEFMKIEKYSHVMHIVSNVRGQLSKDKDALDVLEAAFPAGTVSGAPKVRAMEIIDDLENVARGPYAGAIGYLSFSGNLDTCITIRTIIVHKNKAYIQAGAGIVADSDPHKEFQETVNKARASLVAIDLAQKQTK